MLNQLVLVLCGRARKGRWPELHAEHAERKDVDAFDFQYFQSWESPVVRNRIVRQAQSAAIAPLIICSLPTAGPPKLGDMTS